MLRDNDKQLAVQAVANSAGIAGAMVGTSVDATGFGRARFIFSFGANTATTAALSAGIGVWNASTSGATFAAIAGASLAAVTSGVLSNNVMIIDTVISPASPWLKVSGGSVLSTGIAHSCVVELYKGVSRPPTHTEQQIVTVG